MNFLIKTAVLLFSSLLLINCSSDSRKAEPVTIGILAFNDLHGNLEPPAIAIPVELDGELVLVPAGGMTYLSSAIMDFKQRYPRHLVVSAGDMVSASPLLSSLFLDEPTIHAVNAMDIDFNAVGNHEFDRGRDELLRLQQGGCEQFTLREPCAVRPQFPGANFTFLGANTLTDTDDTLLPAFGLKTFRAGKHQINVGVIGVTTRTTASSVNQTGIAGLRFGDEAQAANRTAVELKRRGADIIILVIHEGGQTDTLPLVQGCAGLRGDIVPILEELSEDFSVVISGHTHRAYVCDYQRSHSGQMLLLTSAGEKGTLATEIELVFDPAQKKLLTRVARNKTIQGEAINLGDYQVPLEPRLPVFTPDAKVKDIIDEYKSAAAELSMRVTGYANVPITRHESLNGESPLGQLIADMQLLAANQDTSTRADLSFMNQGGIRADLHPNHQGEITFGDIYAVLPFGNQLVTKTYTGAQLIQILEEQFNSGTNTLTSPRILQVSRGVHYNADLTKPAGRRITEFFIHGKSVEAENIYRVVTHTFLAEGGDNFHTFAEGRELAWGMIDLDAFEYYLREEHTIAPPAETRITLIPNN